MTLDLTKYGQQFTLSNINEELYTIGATSSDIDRVKIVKHAIIPNFAFEEWPNLEVVENLRYCDSIGGGAFYSCGKLSNDKLDNCSYIGSEAFYECHSIDFKDLSCVQHIENRAFNSSGLNGDIKVGDVSSGGVFAYTEIETVTIPKGSNIGYSCFSGCSDLTIVYNLRYASGIGSAAFYGCDSLTTDIILNNCTLGKEAFAFSGITGVKATNLLSIDPDDHETSGIRAFSTCTNLLYAEIDALPEEIFSYDTNLETVRIPKRTSIFRSAFYGCSGLRLVYNLGYSTYIGEAAFLECSSLENDKLGLGGTTYLQEEAFRNCEKVTFKDFTNVYTMVHAPFVGCSSITEAICNDVGPGWFEDCDNLRQVTVNKGAYLGPTCFIGCTNLETIYNLRYCLEISEYFLYNAGENLTNNTINLTIDLISELAFGNCQKLEWNLPNITISELTNKNYCAATEGTVFHCSDGDLTVP